MKEKAPMHHESTFITWLYRAAATSFALNALTATGIRLMNTEGYVPAVNALIALSVLSIITAELSAKVLHVTGRERQKGTSFNKQANLDLDTTPASPSEFPQPDLKS